VSQERLVVDVEILEISVPEVAKPYFALQFELQAWKWGFAPSTPIHFAREYLTSRGNQMAVLAVHR
jgi:hypothetical protein